MQFANKTDSSIILFEMKTRFSLEEAEFCKAIGLEQGSDSPLQAEPIASADLRYLELLGIRIVEHDPTNLQANYRLGLIWSASGKHQKAFEKMKEISSGSLGALPESNGWMAKELINRKAAGEAIDFADILQKFPFVSFAIRSLVFV